MATNDVTITIKVDDKGTVQGLSSTTQKLGKDFEQVGKDSRTADRNIKGVAATSSNATKNFSKMSQGMGGLVGAYAAFAAQVFALTAAFNFLRSAGDLAALQAGQAAQAAATGVAMKTLTNDIIAATEAQIQFRDAAQAAAIGTAAGLSGDQLTSLGKAAKDVSLVLGRDVTDSFNRLIRGVTKAEPELLDELGIILRLEDASKKYGLAIGKAAGDLTTFERQQAVANEVLEQSSEKYSRVLDKIDPTVNQFNKFGKVFDDITNEFREFANLLLGPVAEAASVVPLAGIAVAAPLLVSSLKMIIPGVEEMTTGLTDRLESAGDRITAFGKRTQGEMAALKFMSGDPTAAKDLQKQAAADILDLEKKSKTGFRGAKKLADGSMLSTRTLTTLIKQAEGGLGAFANMSTKTRNKYLSAFRDMQAATTTLNGTVATTAAKSRLSLLGLSNFAKGKLLSGFSIGVKGIGRLIGSLPMLFMRVIPVIGALGLAFQFLPDSIKEAINAALGIRTIDKNVQRVIDRTKSLNEEFENFSDIQRELATDIEGNYAATLQTLTAVAEFDLSTSVQQQKKLFEELAIAQDEAQKSSDKFMGFFTEAGQEVINFFGGGAFQKAYGEWASGFDEIGEAAKTSIANTLKGLELIPATTEKATNVTKRYHIALTILNDMLDENGALLNTSKEAYLAQVEVVNRAKREFQEFGNAVKNLNQNLKQIPQIVDTAFSSLLPKGQFSGAISGLEGITSQLFQLDQAGKNIIPKLTKFGQDFRLSIDKEDLENQAKLITGYVRVEEIFKRHRDLLNDMAIQSEMRKQAELFLGVNMSKRQKQLLSEELKIITLRDKADKSQANQKIILDAIAASQDSITDDQVNQLALLKEQEQTMRIQAELLEKQAQNGHKLRMALKEGLDAGLESNIYDLITGEESSIKDAIAKVGQTALKSLAKETSRQLTDSIMGLFNQETEEQRTKRLQLETYRLGADIVKQGIIDGFNMARARQGAVQDDPYFRAIMDDTGRGVDTLNPIGQPAARGNTPANPVFVSVVPSPGLGATAEGSTIPGYSLQGGLPPGLFLPGARGRFDAGAEEERKLRELQRKQALEELEAAKRRALVDQTPLGMLPKGIQTDPVFVAPVPGGPSMPAPFMSPRGLHSMKAQGVSLKTSENQVRASTSIEDSATTFNTASDLNFDSSIKMDTAANKFKSFALSLAGTAASSTGGILGTILSAAVSAGMGMIGRGGPTPNVQTPGFQNPNIGPPAPPPPQPSVIMAKRGYYSANGGGVFDGPNSGYPAMLHGSEAVVPLPDGKRIPVDLSGGGNTNIGVNVNVEGGGQGGSRMDEDQAKALGNMVSIAVQDELHRQKRPGGILSPYGSA